jgi:hypothetical protein
VGRCSLWFMAAAVLATSLVAAPERPNERGSGRAKNRRLLTETVRANHPAIAPLAEAIRAVTSDPLEQLIVVDRATRLLVEYDSDLRVYQRRDYHATLDEMIEQRVRNGWTYLRDDCDGRAVFAAHVLAALNIPWRIEKSYWKGHAWVSAEVRGVRYDVLDVRATDPELQTVSYRVLGRFFARASRPPPTFAWRQAWLERAGGDVELGIRLGLLDASSKPGHLLQRRAVNWASGNPALPGRAIGRDVAVGVGPSAPF